MILTCTGDCSRRVAEFRVLAVLGVGDLGHEVGGCRVWGFEDLGVEVFPLKVLGFGVVRFVQSL